MTATVNLSEQEWAELKSLTQEADAESAVRSAMNQYVRYAKRQRLKSLAGTIDLDDNWQELEQREMREQDESCKPRAD
jgi:hypothetical protein